ncbi:MAG: hypothetical protein RLY31_675 [Bacteroidota bacterium]
MTLAIVCLPIQGPPVTIWTSSRRQVSRAARSLGACVISSVCAARSDAMPEYRMEVRTRWLSGAAAMPVSQPYRVFKQTQASSCPSSGRGALTIRPADSMPARRSATWMSGLTFRHLAGGVQIGVQGISGARHYSTRTGNMRCLRRFARQHPCGYLYAGP